MAIPPNFVHAPGQRMLISQFSYVQSFWLLKLRNTLKIKPQNTIPKKPKFPRLPNKRFDVPSVVKSGGPTAD